MKLLGNEIIPLGMGCWPIGGPFFRGAQPLGYSNVEDGESKRTINAALDAGIRLFDTAAVYGAGHAERLLGEVLKPHPDALVVTKIGIGFDEETKQVTGDETLPEEVMPAIERCLRRLQRDRIDILLLHQNELPIAQAETFFEVMAQARQAGKIGAFGWSTDFPENVKAMAGQEGFGAVEHAMNVFLAASSIQSVIETSDLVALIRSPLAMGVLAGRFDGGASVGQNDIRSTNQDWSDYFHDGKAKESYMAKLDAVKELLQTGGRSLAQGALCWLITKSDRNIPLPGARTVAQMQDNAGAIEHGKFSNDVMAEIETLIKRGPEGAPRPR